MREIHDIELGYLHLKYFGERNLSNLITIYELSKPLYIAQNSIIENITELENYNYKEGAIKGLLVLGLASFEIMLSDLLITLLKFYPQKITCLKSDSNEVNKQLKEFKVSHKEMLSGNIIENQIKKAVMSLSYDTLENIFEKFCKVFSFDLSKFEDDLDYLVEIKETRNLLLHNNLVVNDVYLTKTKKVKRANQFTKKLTIDKEYALKSLILLKKTVEIINQEIHLKYGKFTRLELLKRLWNYTFERSGPQINIEDFWHLNEEKDIIDGPWKEHEIDLSSSEETFIEVWKSQRFGTPVNRLAMVHLDYRNVNKLTFLLSAFGYLRMSYW